MRCLWSSGSGGCGTMAWAYITVEIPFSLAVYFTIKLSVLMMIDVD